MASFTDFDKKLIQFIKYAPIVFIVFVSILCTYVILLIKEYNFQNDISLITKEYYSHNKQRSKEEITRVLSLIEKKQKQNPFDEMESKKEILDYVQSVSYADNRYIFIYEKDGKCLAHLNKEYLNKSCIDIKDNYGNFVVKDILDFAKKNKEGFFSYISSYSADDNKEKISYVFEYKKWDWVIGTGFYTKKLDTLIEQRREALEEQKTKNVKNVMILSFVITVILILFSTQVSRLVDKRLRGYKRRVKEEIYSNKEKDKIMLQQSKLATMGEMLSNIAHQWKQPLSVISTASSGLRLKKELGSLTDKEFLHTLDSIERSTKYLAQTIDDFSSFFSPNKKSVEFNIKESFLKSFELLRTQFSSKNIKIIDSLDDVFIFGVQNSLLQVLINILNNAKDELEEKLEQEKYILIECTKKEAFVEISIKDNAGGVKEDVIDRIFEPYFTTKKRKNGTGIGLYMSQEIVTKHLKGYLDVKNVEYNYKNQEFKGACFLITIPIVS